MKRALINIVLVAVFAIAAVAQIKLDVKLPTTPLPAEAQGVTLAYMDATIPPGTTELNSVTVQMNPNPLVEKLELWIDGARHGSIMTGENTSTTFRFYYPVEPGTQKVRLELHGDLNMAEGNLQFTFPKGSITGKGSAPDSIITGPDKSVVTKVLKVGKLSPTIQTFIILTLAGLLAVWIIRLLTKKKDEDWRINNRM